METLVINKSDKIFKATFSKPTKYNAIDDFVNNVKNISEAFSEISKYYDSGDMNNLIKIELVENGNYESNKI